MVLQLELQCPGHGQTTCKSGTLLKQNATASNMCQRKGKYDLLPRPNAAEPLLLEKGHRGEKVNCSFKRFSFLLFQDITDRPILSNANVRCQQLRPLRGPSELVAKITLSAA